MGGIGLLGSIAGVLIPELFYLCGLLFVLGLHRSKVVHGKSRIVQLLTYGIVAIIVFIGLHFLNGMVRNKLRESNTALARVIVSMMPNPPERRPSPALYPTTANEQPPTLNDLFSSDFSNTIKVDVSRWGMLHNEVEVIQGPIKIYLDFQANTKFIGFLVPRSEYSFTACKGLWEQVDPAFKNLEKNFHSKGGFMPHLTDMKDLTFSGRVFIYHEDLFDFRQLADIVDVFRAHNMSVDFRGPEYLSNQRIAWYQKHGLAAEKK